MMLQNKRAISTILTIASFFFAVSNAQGGGSCFRSYEALNAAETQRGANNLTPITRVICSNSVFLIGEEPWALNGNTNYLCGTTGVSTNNCIVRGGNFQLDISNFQYDFANKSNILVSGFTFEASVLTSAAVGSPGRFTFRDCIFRNHVSHSVFAALYFGGPPILDTTTNRRNLVLSYEKSRLEQYRQLLIGGGSEPRSTILIDRCQFLNNSLPAEILFPTIVGNGPIDVFSSFADVTVSNCLFKDNFYEYSFAALQDAYLIRVISSATVNVTNSCMINNYVAATALVDIVADSGLVATSNNYVTETPIDMNRGEPISPCQYMVLKEAYKCIAPEASVCNLPACDATFTYVRSGSVRNTPRVIVNGGIISSSPCGFNIKLDLPCAQTGKNTTLQLLALNNTIVASVEQIPPFFLYGQSSNGTIFGGTVPRGTYKIQALVDGIIQPTPKSFTISGRC